MDNINWDSIAWVSSSPVIKGKGMLMDNRFIYKNLYMVYMIDLHGNFLINQNAILADDEMDAQHKSGVFRKLDDNNLELTDVTIVVELIQSNIKILKS